MTKRKRWTDEEEKFLIENFHKMTNAELGKRLGRTTGAIDQRAMKLDLQKIHQTSWTAEEEEYLRKNFMSMKYWEIGKALGRSGDGVQGKAVLMGLRKQSLKKQQVRQGRKRKEAELEKKLEAERAERRRLRKARKRQREAPEAEAHGTPELLLKFAEQFQVGDTVRVTFRRAHRAWRTYDGRILEVHDRFILVQLPAWKESVNFGSLIDGTVKVLKREQRRAG